MPLIRSLEPFRILATLATVTAGLTTAPFAVQAKIPGATHCYNSICHRVLTLAETKAEVGTMRRVVASYYDAPERDASNPSTNTSSGETFRADAADNAASPIYPDGTQLLVRNEATGIAALIRVNNCGPYHPGRQLDVSRALAQRLGFAAAGTALLQVVVVEAPTPDEARYMRGRHYAAMPGVLGRFANMELAALALDQPLPLAVALQGRAGIETRLAPGAAARVLAKQPRLVQAPRKQREPGVDG